MPGSFKNEKFSGGFKDGDSKALFENAEFENCSFDNVSLSLTYDPLLRSTVRNVRFRNCHIGPGTGIGNALLEDVVIDGVTTWDRIDTEGTAFHRVILRGRIGSFMLTDFVPHRDREEQERATIAIEEANAAFYETIDDFALDISQARFIDEFEIQSLIPGRLIKRNPKTQFLVTRERAEDRRHVGLDFGATGWGYLIGSILQNGADSAVLCVTEQTKLADAYARGVELLHEHGFIDPNDTGATV